MQAINDARRIGPVETAKCISLRGSLATECSYGPADGVPVVLYGDSHASQWGVVLIPLAEEQGLRLTVITKSSCPAVDLLATRKARPEDCLDWREQAWNRIAALRPAVVVAASSHRYLNGSILIPGDPYELWEERLEELADYVGRLGAQVVLIHDNPFFRQSVPECLAKRFAVVGRVANCSGARSEVMDDRLRALEASVAATRPFMHALDLTDRYCNENTCFAVVDGVIGYRDTNHLSVAFMEQLADPVRAAVMNAIGEASREAER